MTREAGRSLEEMIAITGDERKAREWLLGYRQLQKQMEQEQFVTRGQTKLMRLTNYI